MPGAAWPSFCNTVALICNNEFRILPDDRFGSGWRCLHFSWGVVPMRIDHE